MMRTLCLVLTALSLWTAGAAAHEIRPAYLQLEEVQPGQFETAWKLPMRGDLLLALSVVWPETCRELRPPSVQIIPGVRIERRAFDCGDLVGSRIAIDGLTGISTDVLVRIRFADRRVQTNLLTPSSPSLDVTGRRPATEIAADYFAMGIEHILLGADHLLFVLGLILIVPNAWMLAKTVTAFTVAHSITLALATLGVVHVPQAAVEAIIALSILFLACELAWRQRGVAGVATRRPWLIAFGFGLLHGFGFAGALAEMGLPDTDIPLALLTFNLGVEAGQMLFVAAVLVLLWLLRHFAGAPSQRWRAAPAHVASYAIGSLAAFWLIDRVAGFV